MASTEDIKIRLSVSDFDLLRKQLTARIADIETLARAETLDPAARRNLRADHLRLSDLLKDITA